MTYFERQLLKTLLEPMTTEVFKKELSDGEMQVYIIDEIEKDLEKAESEYESNKTFVNFDKAYLVDLLEYIKDTKTVYNADEDCYDLVG